MQKVSQQKGVSTEIEMKIFFTQKTRNCDLTFFTARPIRFCWCRHKVVSPARAGCLRSPIEIECRINLLKLSI